MRQDAAKRNRRPDQRIELLVAANRKLQVARRDALHLEVLCRVAGQLEHFGGQVLEDGGDVDGCFCADAHLLRRGCFEEALDAAAGKLREGGGDTVLAGAGWEEALDCLAGWEMAKGERVQTARAFRSSFHCVKEGKLCM